MQKQDAGKPLNANEADKLSETAGERNLRDMRRRRCGREAQSQMQARLRSTVLDKLRGEVAERLGLKGIDFFGLIDHGANASVGKQLEQKRMGRCPVDDMRPMHARLKRAHA